MIQFDIIRRTAPDVAEAMKAELKRQRDNIELIASENFVSDAVLAAMGSHLQTNMQKAIRTRGITAAASMWIL